MAADQVEASLKYIRRGERADLLSDRPRALVHAVRGAPCPKSTTSAPCPTISRSSATASRCSSGRAQVRDFYDPAEIERVYHGEIIDLVRGLTGAERVLVFGTMTRSDGTTTKDGNQPAFGAHVDYGARTVRDFTINMLGREEAERWLERRHMLINLWRPIRTVYRAPLALADASTIDTSDLFESEVRGGLGDPNRPTMYGYAVAHNPAHRWWYASAMRPDEIWVFKAVRQRSGPDAAHGTHRLRRSVRWEPMRRRVKASRSVPSASCRNSATAGLPWP